MSQNVARNLKLKIAANTYFLHHQMTVVTMNYFMKSDLYDFVASGCHYFFAEYIKQWFVEGMQKVGN